MTLISLTFLLLFLPVAVLVNFCIPAEKRALRTGVLLAFSLLFAFFAEPKSLAAVLIVTAAVFFCALAMQRYRRDVWLCIGVCICAGALCVYKFSVFSMPVGLSFLTFTAIAYLADVYRGTCEAEKNPAKLGLYLSFFPKYTQGPLTRYADFAPARPALSQMAQGAERVVIGLGKKVLLASAAKTAADLLFAASSRSFAGAWLGAGCYAMQIYFDFSGYTDLALGIAAMLGISLPENFDHPYTAVSVTDFWRRWHITLSRWFRDYVYIPLGGNRKGKARQILNLLIVWALTGLWHGTGWNFILWGLYFALVLTLEKFVLSRFLPKLPRVLQHLYALILILFGWVLFRSPDLASAGGYFLSMFRFTAVDWGTAWLLFRQVGAELLLGAVLCTRLGTKCFAALERSAFGRIVRLVLLLAVLALVLLSRTTSSMQAFVYAQF